MIRPRTFASAAAPRPAVLAVSAIALAALVALGACTTTPESNANLEAARASYRAAENNGSTREMAGAELKQAADALAIADASLARSDSRENVDHLAYVARQRVAVADEVAQRKTAERAVTEATAARDQVRLAARTREADTATMNAEAAQRQAAESQRQSDQALRQTADARRQAEAAERQAQSDQQAAAMAQRQARDAQMQSAELQAQIVALNARHTERGLVVTIGDVLFDTNQSMLRPEGQRSVDKLVGFLKQYPLRTAAIEGFTDSVGGEGANQELSRRRAEAVRGALLNQGVGGDRLSLQGYGERYPVAGNDSAGGRQMNRRVEIVLSDETGRVTPR